jgi:protein O-GlcNAc transferase
MRFAAALLIAGAFSGLAQAPLSEFERAVSALRAGNYAAAETGFRHVLAASPRHVGSLQNLGLVYSRTNRLDEAIDVYRQALAVRPKDPGLLSNLGLTYLRKQAYAEALPVFRKLVKINPEAAAAGDPELLYLLTQGYLKEVQTAEASSSVASLLDAVRPPAAHLVRCRLDFEAGRFDEAVEQCREAAANPVGAYDLGVSLLKSGRVEQAMPQLERTIQLDPKFWGSYYYLGKAKLQTHHAEQAIPLLRQAVALNAKSAEACYELGRALMATGQNAEAEQAMQRVKQLRELEVARDVEMLRRK